MFTQGSEQHSYIAPRDIQPLRNFPAEQYRSLRKLGIVLDSRHTSVRDMIRAAMDNQQANVTQSSVVTPVQFLQNWLPGYVHAITAARKIDDLIGISTIGDWSDEEVVQGILELQGTALPYGDTQNIPYGSWNANFVKRTVVRFEEGMRVDPLEEARSARINIDSGATKRNNATLQLEIERNAIGFVGYNNGANNTYGFLNDPNLPAYISAATGASGSTLWSRKTFLEITADIRTMVSDLRNQSLDTIDPEKTNLTLGLATAVVDYLTTISDFGISVREWMAEAYPRIRVVSAPELNAANGGQNVGYLYAEQVDDMSTDGRQVFVQVVPAKFMLLGVQKEAKGYKEDYSNATAGVMCKRPFAVQRITHI